MSSSVRVMSLYNYQKGDKNPPVGPTSIRNSSIGRLHKLYQKDNLSQQLSVSSNFGRSVRHAVPAHKCQKGRAQKSGLDLQVVQTFIKCSMRGKFAIKTVNIMPNQ